MLCVMGNSNAALGASVAGAVDDFKCTIPIMFSPFLWNGFVSRATPLETENAASQRHRFTTMGYSPNGDDNSDLLFFDIETAPMIGAADWVEVGDPPKNYTKADTIEAWKREDAVKQLEKAALDLDLCRVVAIGWAANDGPVSSMTNEPEQDMLNMFWSDVREPGRTLVGFNCLGFDLPVLVRRSQYLGVPVPYLNLGKYKHTGILDVMQMLSFDGLVRARSQSFYCKRFNITGGPVADTITGADIGRLVEAGEWDKVQVHVEADVEKTRALYRRVTGGGA
jgi:hypothetical protein